MEKTDLTGTASKQELGETSGDFIMTVQYVAAVAELERRLSESSGRSHTEQLQAASVEPTTEPEKHRAK